MEHNEAVSIILSRKNWSNLVHKEYYPTGCQYSNLWRDGLVDGSSQCHNDIAYCRDGHPLEEDAWEHYLAAYHKIDEQSRQVQVIDFVCAEHTEIIWGYADKLAMQATAPELVALHELLTLLES